MRRYLAVLLALSVFAPAAMSCSCVKIADASGNCPRPTSGSGPFFVGTVLSVVDMERNRGWAFLSSRTARIRVDESLRGIAPGTKEVNVLTGIGGGDCGISFHPGESYLIDGFVGEDGCIHAGMCSFTRRLEDAGTAIRILRAKRDGGQVPSLAGRISLQYRDLRGIANALHRTPLGNTLVRAKWNGRVYETRADADGLYAFYDLPSGNYEFAPDLPPGTSLALHFGSVHPPHAANVTAGACQERNIDVFPTGAIQGRVLDTSDEMLPGAFVYLVPADREIPRELYRLHRQTPDERGFFTFLHVSPGKYQILVSPGDSRRPEFFYRRTYSPGVHDREAAAIVTIREGEPIKGVNVRVPLESR